MKKGRPSRAANDFTSYSSFFSLQGRWLRSSTPVTYLCKLLGMISLAAFLQPELLRVSGDTS
ncbi:hypothetical protein BK796_19305 [Kosakonia pseudosacchari]|uniref:Uncharacterized protein n=1 Tax=Kosakonia pseudosacchari TaxID=1646340 RepID=A0ABX4IKJ2_9ENTR|nr:hypothetical protein BK796_19305 [Kosakonia pseudosacchari]